MDKFSVVEVCNFSIWDKFVEESPQGTIFSKHNYLKFSDINFKLFLIYKGNQIKAGFVLTFDDNLNVKLDEFVIYGGIMFTIDSTQKKTKAISERFEITNFIIDYLTKSYNAIEMSLSPFFEDVRPFLWYNYHSENEKDKFKIDLRYTSFVDISEFSTNAKEEDMMLFKNLDTIRQRNIRQARSKNTTSIEEFKIDAFMNFYGNLMTNQNKNINQKTLERLRTQIANLLNTKQAVMYLTKNHNGEIIYITIFGLDKKRAYYLFGASNPNSNESYRGTISLWDSFAILAKEHDIKEVDMEGVNSPQRGWFKLSFGGDLKPYYKIYKL